MAVALGSTVLMSTGSYALLAGDTGGAYGSPHKVYPIKWTHRNKTVVNKIIKGALKRHHGDVNAAYKEVDGRRHKPENFYRQNLAIASDYFRARKDVRNGIPEPVYRLGIDHYMDQKKAGKARPSGNGPVSPYSRLARRYMYKGANEGSRDFGLRPDVQGVP
jgi:hypothetical protein